MREQLKKFAAKADDYKKTFESPYGRRVLMDLMKHSCMLHSTFNPTSQNPYDMAFKEGMRNLVLVILNQLHKDYGDLDQLVKESMEDSNVGHFRPNDSTAI
jgi:hypothetical protein